MKLNLSAKAIKAICEVLKAIAYAVIGYLSGDLI